MRPLRRRIAFAGVVLTATLLIPVAAHAIFATMPVIDWTAIARIGEQIGVSRDTLNTLGLYVQQYNQINYGVQEGVALVRGRQLRGVLNEVVGSEFPEFQQLQRDFRNVVADPSMIRQDIESSYGVTSGNFPLIRKKRIDAADATATLGLFDASRMELVSEQEEMDANDIEARALAASPGGAAKLSAAANGALLRSQAYNQRLLARLMRMQALSIARESSIEKEQEQSRQDQVAAVTSMVGSMQLSYGIGDRVR
ncbi:MAG TPA: hypothetical protein VNX88_16685 [Terriglobales bacterium]|jgi:hypothetical protein|nr:hypothetical protein [Terriglobales bacterium]